MDEFSNSISKMNLTQPNSEVFIHSDAISHNIAAWRGYLRQAGENRQKSAGLCGIVKANAYGLGAVTIARLLEKQAIDMLAVYSTTQAAELIAAGIQTPMLVLMPACESLSDRAVLQRLKEGKLHLTIHALEEIDHLESIAQREKITMPCQLFVDTGMSRGGVHAEQALLMTQRIVSSSSLSLAGVYTHFAAPLVDRQFTSEQFGRFKAYLKATEHLRPACCITHCAGTLATLAEPGHCLDMVRIGLGLYGYGPQMVQAVLATSDRRIPMPDLRAAITWKSRLVYQADYRPGETVGYQRSFTLHRPSRLGLVPVGYGDGYPVALSNAASVLVEDREGRQHPAPVIGLVNMDQISIDLTDLPPIAQGAAVTLVSADDQAACSLPSLAKLADSHCYEMLCRLGHHVPRQVVDGNCINRDSSQSRKVSRHATP